MVVFFPETGRGGCFFFPRRDGAGFFFSEAGRGGVFFFSTGRDGAKSLHRPAKGGLNRPASRPCKALKKPGSILVITQCGGISDQSS